MIEKKEIFKKLNNPSKSICNGCLRKIKHPPNFTCKYKTCNICNKQGHNSLLCNDYKGTQLVCTALEELITEDHMPDYTEISEEDFMYDPDSETELNFINLERESRLSDSDDFGSDEVFHSDVSHSEPYKSPSHEPYKSPSYEPYESPDYEPPSDDLS